MQSDLIYKTSEGQTPIKMYKIAQSNWFNILIKYYIIIVILQE